MAKSPCIGVCKIGKKRGLCKGCLRTREEIKGWKRMDKHARRAVLRLIEIRAEERRRRKAAKRAAAAAAE